MELNDVKNYLRNLPLQLNGSDNQGIQVHGRDNIVQLFNVNGVFRIWLSILQGGRGVYNSPCIRFFIYSHRRPENGAIGRDAIGHDAIWLGAIGFWLRKRFTDYLTLQQINLDEYGDRVHPSFGGDVEGHVLGIIVRGTENWQELANFDDNVQTNIENIYNILQGFFDEINGINANVLENEIRQYNENHLEDYNIYITPNINITQNRPNQPVGTEPPDQVVADTRVTNIDKPHNLIYFGAPGTGKSYQLNDALGRNFRENIGENIRENFERVTFYPTYSYAQFVGTYKPVMVQGNTGNNNGNTGREEIAYQFVPGPFLRVLTKAINDPDRKYCLVIEEINRANAAAVFGDVFQLLDRNPEGESEYSIAASEDIKKYLETQNIEIETLSIPQNMYIWATMNSADQGVFPMDTAFKRRWSFEYIEINNGDTDDCNRWEIEGPNINWNVFRKFVNGLLSSFDVNEDKLMGPYFVKADNGNLISRNSFASKVLMYLWEDAARMIRKNIFGAEIKTYSQLVSKWNSNDRNLNNIHIFDECRSKWENNVELLRLYRIMNPQGDA